MLICEIQIVKEKKCYFLPDVDDRISTDLSRGMERLTDHTFTNLNLEDSNIARVETCS